ncbi:MAG: hypothetical protein OXC11_09825 [Rhodospirillales bacterium]|nr:hypothetical protein [Rhodospirillales bacterium]
MIVSLPWQDKPRDETLVVVSEYLSHIAEEFQDRHWRRIRRHYRTCQSVESRPGACHERHPSPIVVSTRAHPRPIRLAEHHSGDATRNPVTKVG